jgi:hypothetical protein
MSRGTGLCALACAVALGLPARVGAWAITAEPAEATAAADPPTTAPDLTPIADGARSEDKVVEQFDQHWNEGRRLFGRKEFGRAAVEFERAYAAVPHADALYNVVVSYAEDGDEVAAASAAQRYIALDPCGDEADPIRCASRRDEVITTYTDLRGRIVELSLDVSAGVTLREIRINGRIVAAKSFPIFVEPGTVEIELVGGEPGQRAVREPKLRPGEQYIIRAMPFRAVVEGGGPRDANGPVTPLPKQRNTKALKGAFYGGVGLTAASAAAMAVMAVLTLRTKRQYEREVGSLCEDDDDDPDMLQQCGDHPLALKKRNGQYQVATNALIGVTAGVAMITAIVGVFAFSKTRGRSANQRASTRVRLRPSGAGLTLSF